MCGVENVDKVGSHWELKAFGLLPHSALTIHEGEFCKMHCLPLIHYWIQGGKDPFSRVLVSQNRGLDLFGHFCTCVTCGSRSLRRRSPFSLEPRGWRRMHCASVMVATWAQMAWSVVFICVYHEPICKLTDTLSMI
jgi:hypothetical protein